MTHGEPSFNRLFAVLGAGVGIVTLALVGTLASRTVGLVLALVGLVAFVGLILYEVGRLLADDAPGS